LLLFPVYLIATWIQTAIYWLHFTEALSHQIWSAIEHDSVSSLELQLTRACPKKKCQRHRHSFNVQMSN